MNKQAMHDDLLKAFCHYQYMQENPMNLPHETPEDIEEKIRDKYTNDYIFRSKVKSLITGVMSIVDKHT